MDRKIKVIVVGCGRMGKIGVNYMHKKGLEIVAAVDANPVLQGLDIGEYAGLEKLNVVITDDLEGELERTKPDIAVCCLFSWMEKNEPIFSKILEHKVNLITTCDEGHYSWEISPESTKRLDELAKKNGVTIMGCGFQDIYWTSIVHTAAGGVLDIQKIEGVITWNTEDYGPALADAYKVGSTVEEFNKFISAGEQKGDSFLTVATNGGLCKKFGFTVKEHNCRLEPCVKDHDVYSHVLGRVIPAGDVVGTKEIVTTTTEEGVVITTSDVCYVFDEGEYDSTNWYITSAPDTPGIVVELPKVKTHLLTMSTITNRIPDVINAEPGYQPNAVLADARYHVKAIEKAVC